MQRPIMTRRQPLADQDELTIFVRGIPQGWGTGEIFDLLQGLGATPTRIEFNAIELGHRPGVKVRLRSPPADVSWAREPCTIHLADGTVHHIQFQIQTPRDPFRHYSADGRRTYRDQITVPGAALSFGVLQTEETMLVMRSLTADGPDGQPQLVANLTKKHLEMRFQLERRPANGITSATKDEYSLKIPFVHIRRVDTRMDLEGRPCLIIQAEFPPMAYRKAANVRATHDPGSSLWDERQVWFRQVAIKLDPEKSAGVTQLLDDSSLVNIGRWLSYRFVAASHAACKQADLLCDALSDHNVQITTKGIETRSYQTAGLWDWRGGSHSTSRDGSSHSVLSALHQMSGKAVLPFELLYQLEVCLSHGLLHESTFSHDFALRLAALQPDRARRLLEIVADQKKRFQNPMDILKLQRQISLVPKKIPPHCTVVRSAVITPTTIYFNNPVVETSNRILRKYRQLEDRFLRVKFRDEAYRGRILPPDDDTAAEIFTRIKRTMANGIVVGDRHFEFLAFGNSQFRENGAYFFAPTVNVTAEKIRGLMGTFSNINVVAKYAARLGQSFSTTRATLNRVQIVNIPDIERNGFCFTDGVGKVSLFVVQMIAQEMGLPSSPTECPSVLQFRLAGCKGVLAIDPNIKGPVVHVRPSQNKFPAEHWGLEICRVSQFSTVVLNQQIILVLSALGVPDEVFLSRLRSMLSDLEVAMCNEKMALQLLCKSIDYNQTTITIASMIMDGFMTAQDPFLISCLRLWRSWSTKYLKEKARILVDQGAFVLGCVDETGILRGHSELNPAIGEELQRRDPSKLPEVFLQIPEFDKDNPSKRARYKVVEGICYVARNPSLHPGDVRVVKAVNVPTLHHLRDCVVFPQTGFRDVPGMCSGGDLDGDDFLVVWDQEMLPREWNHPPMDYTAPDPVVSDSPVTVDQITSFFVQHIRNDNLPRIATAHRYWADRLEEGVKHEKCLELASLHSRAVDYAKTGVPAEMPKHLRVRAWPHWAENAHVSRKNVYHSRKVLGRLYDEVERVAFAPAWNMPFDGRILSAFELNEQILLDASELKHQYDDAVRRIMAQHGIKSEFEVWTTFVMDHNDDTKDYKLAEVVGETLTALKQQFRDLAFEKTGTDVKTGDREKLAPFVVAMYTVTAREIAAANAECAQTTSVDGRKLPARSPTVQSMPLMSFPWLFQHELGRIAAGKILHGGLASVEVSTGRRRSMAPLTNQVQRKQSLDLLGDFDVLPPLEEIELPGMAVRPTDMTNGTQAMLPAGQLTGLGSQSLDMVEEGGRSKTSQRPDFGDGPTGTGYASQIVSAEAVEAVIVPELDEVEEELVELDLNARSSTMRALDRLAELVGT